MIVKLPVAVPPVPANLPVALLPSWEIIFPTVTPASDIVVLNPILILLELILNESLSKGGISSEYVNKGGFTKLILPTLSLNLALQRVNLRSSYWLGFQVSPFWDLN